MTVQACSDADFRLAMRQLPGAVCVIATEYGGGRIGFVTTAVCSVSADPPTLLVCVNKNTSAHDPIVKAGRFSVNLLATQHVTVSETFSGQARRQGSRAV
jgi:flavin reductase (DIM6/NTAB) family NADH-FMN oxidoreductase RutF